VRGEERALRKGTWRDFGAGDFGVRGRERGQSGWGGERMWFRADARDGLQKKKAHERRRAKGKGKEDPRITSSFALAFSRPAGLAAAPRPAAPRQK
jgi:hypothetical protein